MILFVTINPLLAPHDRWSPQITVNPMSEFYLGFTSGAGLEVGLSFHYQMVNIVSSKTYRFIQLKKCAASIK